MALEQCVYCKKKKKEGPVSVALRRLLKECALCKSCGMKLDYVELQGHLDKSVVHCDCGMSYRLDICELHRQTCSEVMIECTNCKEIHSRGGILKGDCLSMSLVELDLKIFTINTHALPFLKKDGARIITEEGKISYIGIRRECAVMDAFDSRLFEKKKNRG